MNPSKERILKDMPKLNYYYYYYYLTPTMYESLK